MGVMLHYGLVRRSIRPSDRSYCCGNIQWNDGTRYEEVIDCLRKNGAHTCLSQREGRKAPTIYCLGARRIGRSNNNNNKKKRNERNARRYLQ